MDVKLNFIEVLICIPLKTSKAEYLFIYVSLGYRLFITFPFSY